MPVLLFLIGLIAGTGLNSLADNLPPDALGMRYPPRRPHCRWCGAAHIPFYWLALVSFLTRWGRCEHCGGTRPVRQAVVETLAGLGLVYAWGWAEGDGLKFLAAAALLLVFLLIAVIDIEHRLILWRVILPSAVIVGLLNSLLPDRGLAKTLWGGLGGYTFVLGVYLLSQFLALGLARVRGQPLEEVAFGSGDVNLAGVVGLAVGWPGVVLALLVTIVPAGLFSLIYLGTLMLRGRYKPYAMAFPYGPFLILGALVLYFYGRDFVAWYAGR